jgi:hypothetical protein
MGTGALRVWCGIILVFFLAAGNGYGQGAGANQAPATEIDLLIELLKEKGVITDEEAQNLRERVQAAPREPAQAERVFPGVSEEKEQEALKKITDDAARRIQNNVRSQVKAELKEEIQREARAEGWYEQVPDWVKRIELGGDIRLRYAGTFYDSDNALLLDPADPDELLNTTEDTNRFRYRLRLSLDSEISPNFFAGVRITTGNEDNPVSTNETLGDFKNKDSIVLDRAFLQWKPSLEFDFWGGRFANPYFSTPLVWDGDINFEGIAGGFNRESGKELRPFVTAGIFPLQDVEFGSSKWFWALQGGTEYRPRADIISKVGLAWYDYQNMTGIVNDPARPGLTDWTAPLFQQKGNTLMDIDPGPGIKTAYASEFQLFDVTASLDFALFYPIHIIVMGDYVVNLGFDQDEVSERAGAQVPEENSGYQLGMLVGHPSVSSLWNWNAALTYRYLEADAVPDAFTDSDFHDGGTNAKGWIFNASLGVWRNIWFSLSYYSTDEISGPPLAIDTLFVDLNAKF